MFKKQNNKCIGIDITDVQLVACAVSKSGEILHFVGVENETDDLENDVIALIEKLLEDSGIKKEEITHIGIGSTEYDVLSELKSVVETELGIKCYLANKN